jgi:uncharacterized membrane protein (UPF0127 family)
MAWLLRDGEVLASLEIASTRAARRHGLLGRSDFEGALLLERTRSVHTFGMRFPIDIAMLDRDGRVVHTARLNPGRLALPRPRARQVLEAEAGQLAAWGLTVGDVVEVRS